MKCEQARRLLPLYVYGELPSAEEEACEAHVDECDSCRQELERQSRLNRVLDQRSDVLPEGMLTTARQGLRARLAVEERPRGWRAWVRNHFTVNFGGAPLWFQAATAVLLVSTGFLGGRVSPSGGFPVSEMYGTPVASRVQYVEPESSGRVQIVVDETRQRLMRGTLEDPSIRDLLIRATREANNPGVRVQSVELLKNNCGSDHVRGAVLGTLQHDPDPSVRLVALDALRGYAWDPETREILSQVLLDDRNPVVRTQVIDVLAQEKQDTTVSVFQDLMRRERDVDVRQQCRKALASMNASAEEY